MSQRRNTDDADAWFYDLGAMARRIEQNEARQNRLRKRQWAALAFFIFAFLLLSYRSEVNADRINRNTATISDTQAASCRGGLEILTRFNALQDRLIEIEKIDPTFSDATRLQRIAAYQRARILPLPDCPIPRESR